MRPRNKNNEKDVRAAFVGVSRESTTTDLLKQIVAELDKNLQNQYKMVKQATASAVKAAFTGKTPPQWSKQNLEKAAEKLSHHASTLYQQNPTERVKKATEILKDTGLLKKPGK